MKAKCRLSALSISMDLGFIFERLVGVVGPMLSLNWEMIVPSKLFNMAKVSGILGLNLSRARITLEKW